MVWNREEYRDQSRLYWLCIIAHMSFVSMRKVLDYLHHIDVTTWVNIMLWFFHKGTTYWLDNIESYRYGTTVPTSDYWDTKAAGSRLVWSVYVSSQSLDICLEMFVYTLIARFMGPTWAHMGPTGPRWASCWPYELCYLGILSVHIGMGQEYDY